MSYRAGFTAQYMDDLGVILDGSIEWRVQTKLQDLRKRWNLIIADIGMVSSPQMVVFDGDMKFPLVPNRITPYRGFIKEDKAGIFFKNTYRYDFFNAFNIEKSLGFISCEEEICENRILLSIAGNAQSTQEVLLEGSYSHELRMDEKHEFSFDLIPKFDDDMNFENYMKHVFQIDVDDFFKSEQVDMLNNPPIHCRYMDGVRDTLKFLTSVSIQDLGTFEGNLEVYGKSYFLLRFEFFILSRFLKSIYHHDSRFCRLIGKMFLCRLH